MTETKTVSIKYEIFGRVQGVSFRFYTKKKADSLGVYGWVQNTTKGTVVGEAIGDGDAIKQLSDWLSTQGPKSARIDNAIIEPLSDTDSTELKAMKDFRIKED